VTAITSTWLASAVSMSTVQSRPKSLSFYSESCLLYCITETGTQDKHRSRSRESKASYCTVWETLLGELTLWFTFWNANRRNSYPCSRPWRPIGLWDVEGPTLSRESAHRWR
jgi:hypothetical protein